MELTGKKVNFLGDSITEGHGVYDREQNRYDQVVKRLCHLDTIYNFGVGGTRLASQIAPSVDSKWDEMFVTRAARLCSDADLTVVYGGVNDYLHGDAPFGMEGDKTSETFCGGVYYLMKYLTSTYPMQKLVFMTPAHCEGDEVVSPNPIKKADAKPLQAYVDVIKNTAKQFDIPVLELTKALPLNPNDTDIKVKYCPDGLHFNDEGHSVLGAVLAAFLKQI